MSLLKNREQMTKGALHEDVVNHIPAYKVEFINEHNNIYSVEGEIKDNDLNLRLSFIKNFDNEEDANTYFKKVCEKYPLSEIGLYNKVEKLIKIYA